MFYVIGKIADKATPPLYGVVEAQSVEPFNDAFKDAAVINHGGVLSDYSFFTAADNSTEATRVMRGDDWAPTWTGDTITALDFSAQDARKWVRFYLSKSDVVVDGSDEAVVSAKIYASDKSGIDTTFESNVDIKVRQPSGSHKMRFTFSKGQASRSIIPDIAGEWEFSLSRNIGTNLQIDPDYVVVLNAIA